MSSDEVYAEDFSGPVEEPVAVIPPGSQGIPACLLAMEPEPEAQTIQMIVDQNPYMPEGMEFSIGAPFSFSVTPGKPFPMLAPDCHLLYHKIAGARYVDPRDALEPAELERLLQELNTAALSQKRVNG